MKRRLLVIAFTVIAVTVLALFGYWILSLAEPANQTLPPIDSPDIIYSDAVDALSAASDLVLTISSTTQTTVSDKVFLEISQQILSCQDLGTQNFRARLDETLTIDSLSVNISEFFAYGTGYVILEDGRFSAQLTSEDYLSRFAPAILLDAQLYGSITGVDAGDTYVLSFAHPSSGEAWALNDGANLLEASGTAYVTHDGQLIKSIYSVSYTNENASYRQTVVVEAISSPVDIALPDDITLFTAIEYFDGPRLLERSTGYLLQAQQVSAQYRDSSYFQAFGDKYVKEISLHSHKGETWSAKVETTETFTNESKLDQTTQHSKSELFADNVYTVSQNGAPPVVNTGITVDDMYNYCRNLLVSTVMLSRYVAGTQLSESESTLRITFTANEAFAQLVSSNTCRALYKEPEMLNTLAQTNTTDILECYLELDRGTGLPVSSGITYSGTYIIEGLPYKLQFQADQIYDLLSNTAQDEISKAANA